ncbi:UPF0149 family protein [Rubrivivax gelatinosus]|uniref:Zinc chelation protein SecC n=1 Tax=Rubrivivax gelatinosus TaxID=28068 RepID=A0ABS1DT97_RUBGE|nr:UPF0149 family protein [Rubrivivax gelatinosus]MBK1712874.1 zinc chelation protein SecC [Rubrivivax gelatinosus]
MKPARQNTEAEIEAFSTVCQRLGGFEPRLSAEWCDGFIAALAAGPRVLAVDEWLPAMAGEAYDRAFADPEDRAAAEQALAVRAAALAVQLDAESIDEDPEALRLAPLMYVWDDAAREEAVKLDGLAPDEAAGLVTGGEWADGFFAALQAFSADWKADADEEAVAVFEELLGQVHALRLADGSDELAELVQRIYGEEGADRDRLVDEACWAVQDLRLWWVDHAPRPETRRVEKTPGRNDPCPCGSGRKYKKCHGAAA